MQATYIPWDYAYSELESNYKKTKLKEKAENIKNNLPKMETEVENCRLSSIFFVLHGY
jgi:hypothetical protein